jgi:hypothetical protein
MCSMPLTVLVVTRSETVTIRRSISCAGKPEYCHTTETTGMLTWGKTSVDIRKIVSTPIPKMSSAMMRKV